MVFWMWEKKIDPDSSAIPYLTALGDLMGIGLLALSFHVLRALADPNAMRSRYGGVHGVASTVADVAVAAVAGGTNKLFNSTAHLGDII